MSLLSRLLRLEATMPEPEPEGEVTIICDVHRDGCRGDDDEHEFVTVVVRDTTVLEPPRVPSPELMAEIRRSLLRPPGGTFTVH